jgi:putative sterol carrier protein
MVLAAWNISPERHVLAGAGTLCFKVLNSDSLPVYIRWDDNGYATRISEGTEPMVAPSLSASASDWIEFMKGQFTAAIGVIKGRIRYDGPLRAILPYSHAFNTLASVADAASRSH